MTNDLAQVTEHLHQLIPVFSDLHLNVVRMDDVLECSVPLTKHNQNHLGIMYAGVLWSAAEVLGGLLYVTHQQELGSCAALVTEANIKFLKPATTMIRARALCSKDQVQAMKAALERDGRISFDLNVELRDEADLMVSTFVARYQYRRV